MLYDVFSQEGQYLQPLIEKSMLRPILLKKEYAGCLLSRKPAASKNLHKFVTGNIESESCLPTERTK